MKNILYSLLLGLTATAYSGEISNETEVGVAVTQGNTRSETYNAKQLNSYQVNQNIFKFNGRYLNTSTNSIETSRYLLLSVKYERELSSAFGLYAAQSVEKDVFAGYKSRIFTDLGGKYSFYKTENTKFFTEAGYRYTTEKRVSATQSSTNSLRIYGDYERKWNANFTTNLWAEYLPNLDVTDDYLFNTELSISAVINSIFSLKTGYLLRYDNLPNAGILHKTDSLLTTAIVSKF